MHILERSKDEEKTYCERTKVKNERYFGILGLHVVKEPKWKIPWQSRNPSFERTKEGNEIYWDIPWHSRTQCCERTNIENEIYLDSMLWKNQGRKQRIPWNQGTKWKLPWYSRTPCCERAKVKGEWYFGIEGLYVVKKSR
jgi:hypothetical protein